MAAYNELVGAPANQSHQLSPITPAVIKLAKHDGDIAKRAASGTSATPISSMSSKPESLPNPNVNPIPPSGDTTYEVVHSAHDADERYLPTRFGNGEFGYLHYASAHNLTAFQPLDVALSESPEKTSGYDLTYEAYLTNTSTLNIYATIVLQTRDYRATSDNRYVTPDGTNIGTITAYCAGTADNECPAIVDQDAAY